MSFNRIVENIKISKYFSKSRNADTQRTIIKIRTANFITMNTLSFGVILVKWVSIEVDDFVEISNKRSWSFGKTTEVIAIGDAIILAKLFLNESL